MIFKACPFNRLLFPVTAHSPGHYFQKPGNNFQGLPIHQGIISSNQEIIFQGLPIRQDIISSNQEIIFQGLPIRQGIISSNCLFILFIVTRK